VTENEIGDAIIAAAMKVHSVAAPLRDGIVRMVNGL
jgi:hypothetical protein